MKSLSTSASTAFAISISPPQRPSGVARSTAAESAADVPGGATIGPGAIGIDEDLIRGQLERQRFRQRDHARLGDVVRQVARIPGSAAPRHPVREVDDSAAARASHVRDCRLRAEPGGAQVDRHLRVPVLERQIVDRLLAIDRRHVDENVEPPEFRDGLLDDAAARLGLLQIGLDDERAPGQRAKRRRPFPPLRCARRDRRRDVRALAGELGGDDRADSASAGDQRDSVGEIHGATSIACLLGRIRIRRVTERPFGRRKVLPTQSSPILLILRWHREVVCFLLCSSPSTQDQHQGDDRNAKDSVDLRARRGRHARAGRCGVGPDVRDLRATLTGGEETPNLGAERRGRDRRSRRRPDEPGNRGQLRVFNLPTGSTASHIHIGPKGVVGPGGHRFPDRPGGPATSRLNFRVHDGPAFHARPEIGINTFADALQAIAGGNAYVNIHTIDVPGRRDSGSAVRRRSEYSAVPGAVSTLLSVVRALPCSRWRARTSLVVAVLARIHRVGVAFEPSLDPRSLARRSSSGRAASTTCDRVFTRPITSR